MLMSIQLNIYMANNSRLNEHIVQIYVSIDIASFGHVIHKNEHIKIV